MSEEVVSQDGEKKVGEEASSAESSDSGASGFGASGFSESRSGQSAGALLREAREAAGVDISSLALALKISVKKLESLEADRYDELRDSVFVRALASSICRTLKVDAAPILARLPKSTAPKLVTNEETGVNTPFRAPGDVVKAPFWELLSRPVVLGALAVLLAALVVIFFPSRQERAEIGAVVSHSSSSSSGEGVVASGVEVPQGVAESSLPAAESAASPASTASGGGQVGIPAAPMTTSSASAGAAPLPVFTAASASHAAASVPASSQAQAEPLTPASTPSILTRGTATATNLAAAVKHAVPAPAASPAPVAASAPAEADEEEPKFARSGAVVFRMRESGWVQVIDASGVIRISRRLEPGTPVGIVNGPFPLRVTVGKPEVTDVTVRGKPFDLAPTIVDGQAKFEVN